MILMLVSALSPTFAAEGLIKKPSAHSVDETVSRVKVLLEKKGIRVFAHVNHQQNAQTVPLELAKVQLLVFGNPKLGTPLMQSNPTVGIDLPMKILVWENTAGKVWIAYNDPAYLAQRHGIMNREDIVKKMSTALNNIVTVATTR